MLHKMEKVHFLNDNSIEKVRIFSERAFFILVERKIFSLQKVAEIGCRNLPDLSRFPVPNNITKAFKDLITFSDSINLSNWEWNE